MRIELGDWNTMRPWAAPLRHAVFVDEQKVPAEMEIDDWDPQCVHAVAFDDGSTPIGTGRLLPDGHVGRMAVASAFRAHGVGSALLTRLMDEARQRGHRMVVLSAQTHAIAFYARHGFRVVSGEYLDCGIPHVDMRREL